MVSADVAVENFTAAIDVDRRLLAAQTATCALIKDRARRLKTRTEIAALQAQNGDYGAARGGLDELLAQVRKTSPGSFDEADLLGRLAAIAEVQGLASQAKQHWREAAAIYAAALQKADREPSPASAVMSLLVRNCRNRLSAVGMQYRARGDCDGAQRLLKLSEQRLGKDHPQTVAIRSDLGALYGANEDYESAKPLLVESLAFWRRHDPPAPIQLAARAQRFGSRRTGGRGLVRRSSNRGIRRARWPSGSVCWLRTRHPAASAAPGRFAIGLFAQQCRQRAFGQGRICRCRRSVRPRDRHLSASWSFRGRLAQQRAFERGHGL